MCRKPDQATLHLWVIYDHPSDFPTCWVARQWAVDGTGDRPTPVYLTASTLETLRALLPPGLHRLERTVHDDAAITEVWL